MRAAAAAMAAAAAAAAVANREASQQDRARGLEDDSGPVGSKNYLLAGFVPGAWAKVSYPPEGSYLQELYR